MLVLPRARSLVRRDWFGRSARPCVLAGALATLLALSASGQDPRALPEPATLDFARLSQERVLALVAESHARGDRVRALAILAGALDALTRQAHAPQQLFVQYHFHRAEALRSLRRFEEALDASEECRRWLARLLDETDPLDPRNETLLTWAENERCSLIGQRGWIFLEWGRIEAARALFEEEREELEALGELRSTESWVDSLMHRASLAATTGSPETAAALLAEGDASIPARARAFLRLSRATAGFERARREGQPLEAVHALFEEALTDPELAPIARVSAELRLAELALARERHLVAREHWQRAGRTLEDLGASGAEVQRRWIACGASLAEPAEHSEWLRRLEGEIDALLAEWGALDSSEDGHGFLHFNDALQLFGELTALSLALDGPELGARRALESLARAHAAGRLARQLRASAPTVAELREFLCPTPDQGLLVYLAGPVTSWVFALDPGRLRAFPLDSSYVLERQARVLMRALLATGEAWDDEGRRAARELARVLVPAELESWIEGWRALVVCGLDLFRGDVPFELLDLGGRGPLGTRKAVWNLPSLAAGVEQARRERARPPARPALRLVAAPALTPEVAGRYDLDLFELGSERLQRILASFAETGHDVRSGAEAHAGALVDAPTVLQFLAHGIYDEARSPGAELALTARLGEDDGLLSGRDVERALAQYGAPRLAVLTACRAGRAAVRAGDAGSVGLTGGFLAGGTSVVVAAACDLDLDLACHASGAFYAALVGGADVAEALRLARAELARSERFGTSAQPGLMRAIGFAPRAFPVREGRETSSLIAGGAGRRALVLGLIALALALGVLGARRRSLRGSN
jgi:hypothetical protein